MMDGYTLITRRRHSQYRLSKLSYESFAIGGRKVRLRIHSQGKRLSGRN